MIHPEYLTLKFSGSKGCIYQANNDEMIWNNARLTITKNGVTTVQNLAGGLDRMDEHVNKYLTLYNQQGWETVKIEIPEEIPKINDVNSLDIQKNVLYILKR